MDNSKNEFSSIYDKFVEKIYRFISVKVNSTEIAEDLTSDTFLRCWNIYKNDKNSIENIQAFLYKIARNLVVDHYRKTARTNIVSIDNYPILDSSDNISESMNKKSDMDNIKTVMANLGNPDYQDVITLHYVDDLSIKEISTILDKSEENVRVLLHRALKAVKNKVSEV